MYRITVATTAAMAIMAGADVAHAQSQANTGAYGGNYNGKVFLFDTRNYKVKDFFGLAIGPVDGNNYFSVSIDLGYYGIVPGVGIMGVNNAYIVSNPDTPYAVVGTLHFKKGKVTGPLTIAAWDGFVEAKVNAKQVAPGATAAVAAGASESAPKGIVPRTQRPTGKLDKED